MGCRWCKIVSGQYPDQEIEETVVERSLPSNVLKEENHEMTMVVSSKDNMISDSAIEMADPSAFNDIFIQQREQVIDSSPYRITLELWRPSSLRQLVQLMKAFAREKSPIDRYWMIFYWIATNIVYDTVSYFSKDYQNQSAEEVFRTRKGVCSGYANLYKYLCDQLQMPCEIIDGYAKGYEFDDGKEAPYESNHAWNAVHIAGHWYLVESTWGAGHLNENQEFIRELAPFYFLPHPDQMMYHHLPENDRWQLLQQPLTRSQFLRVPQIRPIFFQLQLQLIEPRNQYFVQLQKDKPFALVIIQAPDDVLVIADLELNHQKVEGGHQVIFDKQKQQYFCHFAPSTMGKHKITIYAKRKETTIDTYHSAVDLLLEITVRPENPISYPKTWPRFFDFNLKLLFPLHTHVINLANNKQFAKVIIRAPSDIELTGQLQNQSGEIVVCGNQVYYDRQKNFWRCKFAPNENGVFEAIILGKKKNDLNAYGSVVSFRVIANRILVPFASLPQTWSLFYDFNLSILYPLNQGIIVVNNQFRFAEIRIQAPNDVRLVGRFRNDKNEDILGGHQVYYDHERGYWRCKFAPNHLGTFDAMILAKKTSDTGDFTSVVLFKIGSREFLSRPACFLDTTQLFHDLKLKVVSPRDRPKFVLSKKANYVEILLKIPNDVLLLGQLISSTKESIPNADQVYYDRHKDLWCCKFAPNQNGLFEAIILAKKKSDSGPYFSVVTFPIEAAHVPSPLLTFPQTWQGFYDFDLNIEAPKFSSLVPWSKNASYAEVLIRAPTDIQLSGRIEYNTIKIENGCLAQFDHDRDLWQLLFAPERTGLHELTIYARRTIDINSSSNAVVTFNLNVTSLGKLIKFPMVYTQFEATKCRIYTPLHRRLKRGSSVSIHCILPDAELIQVTVDSRPIRSMDYQNSVFKSEIVVGSEEVTIYGKYSGHTQFTSLIRYTVE